ncbi:MAG: hypothetical protein Q4G36_06310 [Paracoccus sp. (in: a-proteobacteria)]|nr:hypothetical protein [Paracoccus sp. (in: a-proteobacteria)]
MKHDDIRSVAHSIADSLACGVSLMTGFYDLRVYEDAGRSESGILTIDLLNGIVVVGTPSSDLASAVMLIPKEFDRLSRSKGFERKDCRAALAVFHADLIMPWFTLVIEDSSGRVAETDYQGVPARRVRELDPRGRLRRKPIRHR